jgi:hypothetical protein
MFAIVLCEKGRCPTIVALLQAHKDWEPILHPGFLINSVYSGAVADSPALLLLKAIGIAE